MRDRSMRAVVARTQTFRGRRSAAALALGLLVALAGCGDTPSGDADTDGDATLSDSASDTTFDATQDTISDTNPDATSDTAVVDSDVEAPAGIEVASRKAAYHVWFDGPSGVRAGIEIRFRVTVRDLAGAPVTGLALAPTYIHAEMGHDGREVPVATELGDGAYEIAGLVATMAGTWEVKVFLPNADSARIAVIVTP